MLFGTSTSTAPVQRQHLALGRARALPTSSMARATRARPSLTLRGASPYDRHVSDELSKRIDDLHKRFDDLRSDMDKRFGDLRADMDNRFSDLRSEMSARFSAFDKRLDDMNQTVRTFMWVVSGWFMFLTAVLAVFGFLRR